MGSGRVLGLGMGVRDFVYVLLGISIVILNIIIIPTGMGQGLDYLLVDMLPLGCIVILVQEGEVVIVSTVD